MITIKCSEEEYNTIYTALRMELERNAGNDQAVKFLTQAIAAVQSALN